MKIEPKKVLNDIESRRQEEDERRTRARNAVRYEEERRVKESPEDEVLFEKYKKIVKGERYVKLEHIDALGVEYDVLFFTTVKNTGKTTNIVYNRFYYYFNKGQKVVYIRNSIGEFEKHLHEFNRTESNPFIAVKRKNTYVLLDKKTNTECGLCTDMKSANLISGGNFDGYGAIIFDEALTWNPNNVINESHISNLFVLPSSVQRDKTEKIKVYLVSNIPATSKNLLLLDYLGIDINHKLRYITRGNTNNPNVKCNILYINAGNIFKGINDQDGAAQMASQAMKMMIGSNKLISAYDNTIGLDVFTFLKSKFAFIFTIKDKDYLIHLKHIFDPESERMLHCIHACVYEPIIYVDCDIYTDNAITASMYERTVIQKHSIKYYKSQLILLMRRKKVLFTNDISVIVCKLMHDLYLKENTILF